MVFSSHASNSRDDKRDFQAECLLPTSPLKISRLVTTGISTIRLVPEIRADGAVLPAAVGQDDFGFLFSNLAQEGQVILAGQLEKHCGFTRSADRAGEKDLDNPWSSLYIYFKGVINKVDKACPPNTGGLATAIANGSMPQLVYQLQAAGQLTSEVTPAFIKTLYDLTKREQGKKSSPLQPVGNAILMQGFVLQENNVWNPQPERAIISIGSGGRDSLVSCLTNCIKLSGKDPFALDQGYTLKVSGKASGDGVARFFVELGDPIPLPPEWAAAAAWVPWEKCLKLLTYDENVRAIVRAYGAGLVSQHPRLREDMVRLGIAIPAALPTAPAMGQPAVQQVAPASFGPVGQLPTGPVQPPAAFGAPPTAATAARPVAPTVTSFGTPPTAAPVAANFVAPTAATPVPGAPPVVPLGAPAATKTPAELMAAYQALVNPTKV
jgi:hypothetical protein